MIRTPFPALCSILALVVPATGTAVDFAVTRYDDPVPGSCAPTDCSLREAVIAANQSPGADRIILSAGRYELAQVGNQENAAVVGDLDVLDDLEVLGVAANLTIIDGNFVVERLFEVPVVESISLRFADLALTGGSGLFGGSAVQVARADLVIERCEIFENLGATSSIIAGVFSTATIRDTTARTNGGGLTCSQSDCLLANVTLTDNGTNELRGSIGATITCQHCSIYDGGNDQVIELDSAALQIGDSVVQGSCALTVGAFVFSAGGNIESPGQTCDFTAPSDVDDAFTAALLALAPNGGATLTRRPQSDGPSGVGAMACVPELDQTGWPRPAVGCSRGAVQAAVSRTLIPVFIDGFEQGDAEAWSAIAP
jgi:CSLREA domain-containing protein